MRQYIPILVLMIKMKTGNNVWDILNNSIDRAANNHLRDLRFDKNYKFNGNALKQEAFSIVSTISRFIEKDEDTIVPFSIDDEDIPYIPNNEKLLDSKTAKLILELIRSSNPESKIESMTDEDIAFLKDTSSKLMEYFIRDPYSNCFSKSYLKSYLLEKLCKSNSDYQALYVSDVGIRLSNTAYSHSYTDMRIIKTTQIIKTAISKLRKFNKESFHFSEEYCHLIDQGGGNYLILIPQEIALTEEEIKSFVQEVNSHNDITKTNSSFLISCSSKNNIERENPNVFLDDVRSLKDIANTNKSTEKSKLLTSIDNKNSLKKTLYEISKYYKDNVENPNDISKKQAFLTNVFSGIISQQSLHNEKIDKDIDQEIDL